MGRCNSHDDLISKITDLSEQFYGLRGELKVIIPEIRKSSENIMILSQKMAAAEGSQKATWKTSMISATIGVLASGFIWSALSFFQRVV